MAIVAALAVAAAVAAGYDMATALRNMANLHETDVAGRQLVHEVQASARAGWQDWLESKELKDATGPEAHLRRLRDADQAVEATLRHLARLPVEEQQRASLEALRDAWAGYLHARAAEAAVSDASDAIPAAASTAVAFHHADGLLTEMAQEFGRRIEHQVNAARDALRRSAIELIVLLLMASLVALAYWQAQAGRKKLVELLQHRHEELRRSQAVEQKGTRILELVGRNEPLDLVLEAIAKLIEGRHWELSCAVFVVGEHGWRCLAAPRLPEPLRGMVEAQVGPLVADEVERRTSIPFAASGDTHHDPHHQAAARCGFVASFAQPIRSNSGELLGAIRCYTRQETRLGSNPLLGRSVLASAAHFAAVAIEHRRLYERLAFQAQHDALTELPNRILFQDRLTHALQMARRDQTELAVLWVDLDRFKQINDTLGHRVGDAMLRQVGQRLVSCVRRSDTVARIGGDEFCLVLNGTHGIHGAQLVADKVIRSLRQPMNVFGHSVQATCSIGISVYPLHGDEPTTLVKHADTAMYQAKADGKNRSAVFSPDMGAKIEERWKLEQYLKTALQNHEFELVYQPQTNLEGRLIGVEALLRWTHPELGSVSPADFIPVAEESGLILSIGEWVLRTACRQAKQWQTRSPWPLRVAVNVSSSQFAQGDFCQKVAAALRNAELPPDLLELEITETALMKDVSLVQQQLLQLRRLGVRISIDDFGTGYSSLSYLRQLPVDSLKIDRSFVGEMDSGSRAMVGAIIGLGHCLELKVVAEGVETRDQMEALRELGCDSAQGFLLHRPMPVAQIEQLLELTWKDNTPPATLPLEVSPAM